MQTGAPMHGGEVPCKGAEKEQTATGGASLPPEVQAKGGRLLLSCNGSLSVANCAVHYGTTLLCSLRK